MPFDALTICAKNQVRKTLKRFEATHLISLVDPDDRMPRPHRIAQGNHLVMHFDDVDDPALPDAPRKEHIDRAFKWVARLPETARLVVHCTAGISRSTALAYGLLCHQMNNDEAMTYVQRVRPEANPYKLMMELIEANLQSA
jgi:predicted protein tyrosine phosphatase